MWQFLILSHYSEWLMSHEEVIGILLFLLIIAVLSVLAFPAVLIILFFVEGINIIRHEGMKPSNILSLLFSILLYAYLAVWPVIGNLQNNTFSTILYVVISFAAVYILSLMAMYALSAVLNLIHLKKKRNADYIIATTAYHVFRALILARQQGIKCVGFGAKTKWYFTLNALLREFAGYMRLSWKKHAAVIGVVAGFVMVIHVIFYIQRILW